MGKDKQKIFERLIADQHNQLYRICYAYLYDQQETEDLLQEIYLNLWRGLATFRGEAQLSTWMYRVAVNTALMYNKRQSRGKDLISRSESLPQIPHDDQSIKIKQEQESRFEQMAACIHQLPEADRLMITLMLEGKSYKEIAAIMGLTVNHIGVKINRIKLRLQKMIKAQTYER